MASLITVGQVLDSSFEHCKKHYQELIAITLWMVVASIPSVVGKLIAPGGDDSALSSGDWLSFGLSLFGAILVVVVSVWMYAALILAIADQANNKRTSLSKIYTQAWKQFIPYALLTFLVALIIAAMALIAAPGYILLIASGVTNLNGTLAVLGAPLFFVGASLALFLIIKYSIELAFAPFNLLLEKQGVVESIKNSLKLVKGRWWAVFARFVLPKLVYLLLILVITMVVFTAIGILMGILVDTSPVVVFLIYAFSLLLRVFLSTIITPLIIATDYFLYDSLRKT